MYDTYAQLYVRALDQLDAVPLAAGFLPFISPDANWVGFYGGLQDQTLKKVSIHGGPPITITETNGIAGASWGPDDTIIFAMGRAGLFRVSAADGREPESLTTLEEDEIAHRWPHILPGGQSVLFTVVRGRGSENMEIAALKLDTRERIRLVPGGGNPHYAPTGHLVYGVDGTLWAVPFDPDRLAVTGEPVPVLEGVMTHGSGAAQFSFAADGSLVYLPGATAGGAERTLVWVDRQGNETPLDLQEARNYGDPRLSPDGMRLAVTVRDENNDVWVADLASGTLRRLTTDPATDAVPLWTPDGERVVFASQREGSWGLFSMAWDGAGDAERLMVIEDAQNLLPYGWSADGALIFEYRTTAGTSQDIGMLPGGWGREVGAVARHRSQRVGTRDLS